MSCVSLHTHYVLLAWNISYLWKARDLLQYNIKYSSGAAKQEFVKMDRRSKVTGHSVASLPLTYKLISRNLRNLQRYIHAFVYFWVIYFWIKGVLLWKTARWSSLLRSFWSMVICFTSLSEADGGGDMQRCVSGRVTCGCLGKKEESDGSQKEWEEGARLICRFRSTFSWEEDPCCFPLWPCLTVWIHYAFRGALVQKWALNPPCPPANPSIGPTFIILTFPLRGEWHQSGSSTLSSVRRWTCRPHSVRGRLPACTGFVVSEEERRSLGQHN